MKHGADDTLHRHCARPAMAQATRQNNHKKAKNKINSFTLLHEFNSPGTHLVNDVKLRGQSETPARCSKPAPRPGSPFAAASGANSLQPKRDGSMPSFHACEQLIAAKIHQLHAQRTARSCEPSVSKETTSFLPVYPRSRIRDRGDAARGDAFWA